MGGWGLEMRGQSFHVYGPGGHEFENRAGLPFTSVPHGWWVPGTHLRCVAATLELAEAALERCWRSKQARGEPVRQDGWDGPDRGVRARVWERGPEGRPGFVFTGLPEHAWGYTHLRSLEFTYAELPRLVAQLHTLREHPALAQVAHWSLGETAIPGGQVHDWHIENGTWDVYNAVHLRLRHEPRWPPGYVLPSAGRLASALGLRSEVHLESVVAALHRLERKGHLTRTLAERGPVWVVAAVMKPGPVAPVRVPVSVPTRQDKAARVTRTYREIASRIASGQYPVGEELPSRTALCREFKLSQQLVTRVLDVLVREGWAQRWHGRRPPLAAKPAAKEDGQT